MTTVTESVRELAQIMADGRTGKSGAPVSVQDYHMAVLSHKHFGMKHETEVRTTGPMTLKYTKEEIEQSHMVSRLGLKALAPREGVVLMRAWAGSTIWTAIDEGLEVHKRTGRKVVFDFNDRLVEIGPDTTKESAYNRWDRSIRR